MSQVCYCYSYTHTHTLLENHTTDVHDYNEREQLIDKTKVTMVIYLDYNVKRLQLTKERLKTIVLLRCIHLTAVVLRDLYVAEADCCSLAVQVISCKNSGYCRYVQAYIYEFCLFVLKTVFSFQRKLLRMRCD